MWSIWRLTMSRNNFKELQIRLFKLQGSPMVNIPYRQTFNHSKTLSYCYASGEKNVLAFVKYSWSHYSEVCAGAIIGDGDRKRAPFIVLGLAQGRGRTLCDAWHIFCVWIIQQKVTSHPVKKRAERQKLNLNATSSFSLQLKEEDFVIGRMFLTFYLAIITRILSSSSPYRLFEEQDNYLLKNTPFWRHVLSRNVVISSSLNSAGVIVCVEIMNSR